jgi:tetratricopeptide (TPR) repeat protein
MQRIVTVGMTLALAWLAAGCAMSKNSGPAYGKAENPALSVYTGQEGMAVWVSPARQTLQIAGSYGAVLGSAVSAVVDSVYEGRVNAALGDYDPRGRFEARLQDRLTEGLGKEPALVNHLTTTAGYANVREAAKARYGGLAVRGHDQVFDADLSYGIFGDQGIMVVNVGGRLTDTSTGHPLYRRRLWVSAQPILADDPLKDPTDRTTPNLTSPRFAVKENAIEQWIANDGALLKERFEAAVDGVLSALLVDLGMADEAAGHFYLGKQALLQKKFDVAEAHLDKAIALDPANLEAKDTLAITYARTKRLDDAVALSQSITEANPDHAPAHYNLAYWYAVKKKDAQSAKPHYDKAIALGMTPSKAIVKRLKKAGLQ